MEKRKRSRKMDSHVVLVDINFAKELSFLTSADQNTFLQTQTDNVCLKLNIQMEMISQDMFGV